MTYARKTLSEIKLIHGNYGNFIKGQKLPKDKEKKYKTPPYQDLAASTELEGETLDEKCWPGYEKKGMKTMFGKRYPNCVKKKKTRKEDFSDWRSELEEIEEKKMTKAQIKKRDEIADAISTKDMKDRYGDKNVKYAIATKLAMKEGLDDDDKPFVKKLVGKLRKGSKTHAKQADDLEKAMKENVNLKFHLGGNKKEISLNYGNTPIAYKRTEKSTSKTSPNTAINKALVQFKKKDDFVKKNIGEDITDEALTIQDWNVDDIKFTEIETVDIIKAKPLKVDTNLEEGIKRKIVKKLVNKVIKKIKKEPVKYSVDKALSQKVQLQSIKNQAKYPSQFGKQINKGNTPVKVDLSKPIDFDKYIGTTKPKKSIKKFGSERPTGTFTDDLPPVQNKPLTKKKFKKEIKKIKPKKPLKDHFNWREELDEDWQKVNRKDKTDGMSKAAVKAYRKENPGSKLKTAVTKDPKKLKKGSKSAKRRLAFCRRMKGMKKKLTSAKTSRDPNSRINKALRRWNC